MTLTVSKRIFIGVFLFFCSLLAPVVTLADQCQGFSSDDNQHVQVGKCIYKEAPEANPDYGTTASCGVLPFSCNGTKFKAGETCTSMMNSLGFKSEYHSIADSVKGCVYNSGAQYFCCANNDITQQNGGNPVAPPPPCIVDKNGQCHQVNTGLGIPIQVDPSTIVGSIFGVLLGISGGIALVILIISGYRIMFSRGDPEKLKGAREAMTSAVIGLLFIIFSLVILRVIGVDILHLPGLM